jgi:hypothetical protein
LNGLVRFLKALHGKGLTSIKKLAETSFLGGFFQEDNQFHEHLSVFRQIIKSNRF